MTGPGRGAGGDMVGRTLCDIAQVLESAQGAQGRVRAALELLAKTVPYRQCALLEAELGCDPRITTLPALPRGEENGLKVALVRLFGQMIEERALAVDAPRSMWGAHLAVPLIGLDEVIGVLFVRREQGEYDKPHLRTLSLVAAQLAAYLTMLRARAEEMGRDPQLQEARRKAELAQRAREQLLRLAAHEKHTPLAAAMAWFQLLGARNSTRTERARAVAILEHGVRTRDRLVADLLALCAAEELRLEPGPVDLAASVDAAVEAVRPLARQRSITLDAAGDAEARVQADAGRIDEVLAVLLANAFDLTPDGGKVQARLLPREGEVHCQVTNSGTGFAPGRLAHLFEGLGLLDSTPGGLAIVKHLVELHGGQVRAESAGEGQGATFTLELPREPRLRPDRGAFRARGG